MNWSSVKNLLILILVAANLFLVFNITRQNRTRNYISDEEIDEALELLSKQGLVVPKSAVPEEKFRASVYKSSYNDEYYTNAAAALTKSPRELTLSLPDGGFSITAKNGETVDFDTEFGFAYSKYDTLDPSAYTDITADNFNEYKAKGRELGLSEFNKFKKKAESFLNSVVPTDYILSAEAVNGFFDKKTGDAVILLRQRINEYEIYSHYAVCVFRDEALVYSRGRWYFSPFDEDYRTELSDQINILFTNLSVLKSENSPLNQDADNGGGINGDIYDGEYQIPAVKSISSCYTIYWSADKTALFFIPAWQIEHIGGLVIVYNATNSTIYA